jgi:S-DNA-T family DNA segregation ATPase FtsK/SpoIIIE
MSPQLYYNACQQLTKGFDMTDKTKPTNRPELGGGAPGYQLPPITLLDELPPLSARTPTENTEKKARILQATLEKFGVEGQVTHVETGPTVTSYEITPAPGVRVERIAGLEKNIELALRVQSICIQAPIPGKGAVGIEVPNTKGASVYLRELVESPAFQNPDIALPFALGKDVSGQLITGDLAAMPHLLIVGAAESGKTACLNSMITGLLLSRSPEQLRLILIDPKTFEFQAFEYIQHLVAPVITDTEKAILALRWAVKEMEKRYALFKTANVRNIEGYNALSDKGSDTAPARLPRIVIVVDEMAEMMRIASPEIEPCIIRLAQLSRAAGIHMILATQCPAINVITGLIKANIPGRIAFQVAQGNDSRTILDTLGAEKLLGKGDMLYLPLGKNTPVRLQGAWTSEGEMHRVTDFIRSQGSPEFLTTFGGKPPKTDENYLLEAAINVIRGTKTASTSSLQHHLKISDNDAFGLMIMLEEKGIVGPPVETGTREILIDLDNRVDS